MTTGTLVALIILACIVIILYSPKIANLVLASEQDKLVLPLLPTTYYETSIKNLRDYGEATTGVPGYSANVYVQLKSSNVAIGDTVDMQVIVENTGKSLHNPYFYVIVVNNTGTSISIFPDRTYINPDYKLEEWWTGGIQGYDY